MPVDMVYYSLSTKMTCTSVHRTRTERIKSAEGCFMAWILNFLVRFGFTLSHPMQVSPAHVSNYVRMVILTVFARIPDRRVSPIVFVPSREQSPG